MVDLEEVEMEEEATAGDSGVETGGGLGGGEGGGEWGR